MCAQSNKWKDTTNILLFNFLFFPFFFFFFFFYLYFLLLRLAEQLEGAENLGAEDKGGSWREGLGMEQHLVVVQDPAVARKLVEAV